ncbi:MAG: hypothetical protein ACFN27_05640 [Prevotella sp.]
MKKLLVSFLLLVVGVASAVENKFVSIDFGTSRHDALSIIKERFGEPNAVDGDNLVYYDLMINGYCFNKIIFGFEPKQGGDYFNEARFFIVAPSRPVAVADRDSLAYDLGKEYDITHDFEENGNKFYKGGVAPSGIGHLFTISTHRREGKWTTELRFGAFHRLIKKQ